MLHKIGEVVLSALPARLRTDDTQAYIRMDCKRGNPVSALGVGGNGLWTKIIVAHTLKWPSDLVCLATKIILSNLAFNMIHRYKKELSLAIEREANLERSRTQAELDWQRRCEDLERVQYSKSEELIERLTNSKDEVLHQACDKPFAS